MRVFNETKTIEVQEKYIDYNKYKLEQTQIFKAHHEAVEEVKEQSHYEVVKKYPNGGKDVKKIIDVEYVAPKEAYDEYEDILFLVPLTKNEILENLRSRREFECFPIINRGQLWYNTLTENQIAELNEWYNNWLDVTNETNKDKNGEYIIPQKPIWIK